MTLVRGIDPPRTVDPYYRQAERIASLEKRLSLLERPTATTFVRTFSAAASGVLIPAFDGNSASAVRITLTGVTASTSTNTFIRLKPNGLSSMSTRAVAQRAYTGASSPYTPTQDVVYGGAGASSPGIVVCATDWSTASNGVWASGFLSLPVDGNVRMWLGNYGNEDAISDGNRRMNGRIHSVWADTTTVVSSLSLSIDAGTFSGRVVVELLP